MPTAGIGDTIDTLPLPEEWLFLRQVALLSPWLMAVTIGPDHHYAIANGHYREAAGFRPLVGQTIRQAFPEFASTRIAALFDQVYCTGTPVFRRASMPGSADQAEGSGRLFDISCQPLYRSSGVIGGILIQGVEVTDRERVVRSLATANRQVITILESISYGCDVVDSDWRFRFIGSQIERAFGSGRGSLIGRSLWEVFPEMLGTPFEASLRDAHNRRAPVQFDFPSPTTAHWYRVQAFPSADGMAIFYADFTDRREAELERELQLVSEHTARVEAEAAVQAREQFLAVVAHELRGPLAAIKSACQLVRRKLAREDLLTDDLARLLAMADEAMDRETTMIGDLLDIARLQTGQFKMALEDLDLVALTTEVLDRYRDSDLHDRHPILVDQPIDCARVRGDPRRLTQVLSNLLDNAIKYSPAGGPVRIRIDHDGDGVTVTIADDGIGFAPGEAESIFSPFARSGNAQKSAIAGLGVGLYVCRLILSAHNGRITAESPGEGRGTTVRVWLPRSLDNSSR